MRPTDPDERRRVRVQYVPRGYGLALTIFDDNTTGDPSALRQAAANDVSMVDDTAEDASDSDPGPAEIQTDDGYLTVIASGVTTLELRRPDGESSLLIWDEAEVAWDSLRAG